MASATGFGTPTPPQWTGVQTLVQNWLKSKSPEFVAQQAQIQKENEFRRHQQELADKQYADTHAQSQLAQEQGQFNLGQLKRQYHLMTYNPQEALSGNEDQGGLGDTTQQHDMYGNLLKTPTTPAAAPNQDESVPTGQDVGQEQAPPQPASGATLPAKFNRYGLKAPSTAAPGEPSSFKNPQQPSSQTTTTMPRSDQTETATSPSTEDAGFDYNIYGFKVGTGHPGDVHGTNPKTVFSKPARQIPSLKGDQKASNEMPDVPSSGTTTQPSGFGSTVPQPDTKSGGAQPRGRSVPQATTASSAAAGGPMAGPEPDAMQFGIHGKPFTSAAVRGSEGEASHDASTPWERLSPSEQKKVIAGYQKGAPEGTTISPTEAVRAYRMQQLARSGFQTPQGMYMKSMKVDPATGLPTVEYEASPFADEGEGGAMGTPAGMEMAGKVDTLNKAISGDENLKSAQNVIKAYGNMLNQAELAKTSKAPGVNDRTLAQLYVQTFAPNAKFNEATQELVGDTHSILESIKQPLLHALSGQTLLPEHREALLESARLNAQAAHDAAIQSTMAPRQLGELALGHRRALQLLTQVPELPGGASRNAEPATGTSPRVGNGTVEGSAGSGQHKTLDAAKAQEFLDQAGGNKNRARELARSAGYDY